MFKKRLLQLFRRFKRAEQEPVEAPVGPDLQTRLQHVTELYPEVESNADDVAQVTVYNVDLTEDCDEEAQDKLREDEKRSLNHWATKRRKTENPEKITKQPQFSDYEIDPIRSALKSAEAFEKNKGKIQSPFPNCTTNAEYQSASGSSFTTLPNASQSSGEFEFLSDHRNDYDRSDTATNSFSDFRNDFRQNDEPFVDRGSAFHRNDYQTNPIDEINEVRTRAQEKPRAKEKSPAQETARKSGSSQTRSSQTRSSQPPEPVTVGNRKNVGPAISNAAVRSMLRLEQTHKTTFSRSLDKLRGIEDTALADQWDCHSSNSLFALPDESSRFGTTAEYEEDYEEDLLPYFTETLLLQEDELGHTQSYDQMDSPFALPAQSSAVDKAQTNKQPSKKASSTNSNSVSTGSNSTAANSISTNSTNPNPANSGGNAGTESSSNLQPYKSFSDNALKLIAQKPETPALTLKWLASHSNPHIRAAVAKNPSTPGDTITVLAKDHEAGIRHSIAENVLSSMDALNLLVKDRNPLISWRAQHTVSQIKEQQKAAQKAKEAALQEAQKESQHTVREAKIATTEETIAFLQVIARKTNTPARRLDELARHVDVRVRAAVAENANAPAEILWLLSRDADSTVKTKVTDNYNCPIEILEAMKEDEDAYVAYQAHSQLNRVLGSSFSDVHIRTATWP